MTCHERLNENAAIYVAVDSRELPAGRTYNIAAGGSFEVDYHFTNMVEDTARYSGVGMAIEVPSDPVWDVTIGTLNHPQDWSQAGRADRFWDPSWDRGANGDGPAYARWVSTDARPELYYLSFAGLPWNVAKVAQSANDRGSESPGDLDRVPNHMGTDAVINVPREMPPGQYQVTVYGVGHDIKDRRAYVSATIELEVSPPNEVIAQPPAQAPDGEKLYGQFCSGCHGATPNMDLINLVQGKTENDVFQAIADGKAPMPAFSQSLGGSLTNDQITAVAQYVLRESKAPQVGAAPLIPHLIQGREACLDCHGPGGTKPVPANHSEYVNSQCTICHKEGAGVVGAPDLPHPLSGFETCTVCHSLQGPVVLPEDHVGRTDATCLVCHQPLQGGQGP